MSIELIQLPAGQPIPSPEELDAYLRLSNGEIAQLVLCLLLGEAARNRLAAILSEASSSEAALRKDQAESSPVTPQDSGL